MHAISCIQAHKTNGKTTEGSEQLWQMTPVGVCGFLCNIHCPISEPRPGSWRRSLWMKQSIVPLSKGRGRRVGISRMGLGEGWWGAGMQQMRSWLSRQGKTAEESKKWMEIVTTRCLPKQPEETVQLLLKTKMLISCKKVLPHRGMMVSWRLIIKSFNFCWFSSWVVFALRSFVF